MRTIAIMNNKGGVGKTVTAINLADILVSQHDKKVVLVDCDGQANLTMFYLGHQNSAVTTTSVMADGAPDMWQQALQEIKPGLWLLPSDSGLYQLDVKSIGKGNANLSMLIDLKATIAEDIDVDFLIFDCPPGFTGSSIAALLAADEVVIPMTMDGFGVFGVKALYDQIASMHKANHTLSVAGILITQWHNSSVVTDGETFLRGFAKYKVFDQVIRRTDKVPESTFDRSPILDYSPTSAAGQDYRAWVKELLGEV